MWTFRSPIIPVMGSIGWNPWDVNLEGIYCNRVGPLPKGFRSKWSQRATFFFLASAQGVYAVYLPWSSSEKIRKDLKISETSGTPTLFSWYISILWNSNGGSKISDRWGVWDVFQQRSTWQAGQPGSSCSQRGVEAKQRTRQVQLGWNWRISSDF